MVMQQARLILRPIIGAVVIALPLTGFEVTTILTIIMVLMVVCVVWENVTSLVRGAKFWEPWTNTEYPETDGSTAPLLGSQD